MRVGDSFNTATSSRFRSNTASNWHKRGLEAVKSYTCPNTDEYWYERRGEEVDYESRALWAAVLQEALDCTTGFVLGEKYASGKAREVMTAKRWIQSDATGTGTFNWVCAVLKLTPHTIRAQLQKGYKRKQGQRSRQEWDILRKRPTRDTPRGQKRV